MVVPEVEEIILKDENRKSVVLFGIEVSNMYMCMCIYMCLCDKYY